VAIHYKDNYVRMKRNCDSFIEKSRRLGKLPPAITEANLPFYAISRCYEIKLEIYNAAFDQTKPHLCFESPFDTMRKIVRVE